MKQQPLLLCVHLVGKVRKPCAAACLLGGVNEQANPAAHEVIQPVLQLVRFADELPGVAIQVGELHLVAIKEIGRASCRERV